MDLAGRKRLYNACKPTEPLDPSDPRYVPIDQLGDPEHPVRGEDWAASLARKFEFSDEPLCMLVTGLPGSGKSTELRRLAWLLEDPQRAHYLPVVIDAESTFDLATPIDVPDLLFAILDGVDRELLRREQKNPDDSMAEGVFRRIFNFFSRTDVDLTRGELAVPQIGRLVVEMKTRPTLRKQVRTAVGNHLSRVVDEVKEELSAMEGRAQRLGFTRLVVVFDSLEKLRGISSNWTEVLESAERVFSGGAPHLRLPLHVLYTIPTALVTRRRFEHVKFMPMIKLRERDGREFPAGVDAAFEIVTHRVPIEALREMLGDALEERVRRLIDWSGGYPREIVRLLQSMIEIEPWPLRESDFARVLNEVGDQYRKLVPASAFDWLARVATDQYWTLENEDHRATADLMLSNNAVLRYLNNEDWFDLHPAVRRIPGVVDAIEARKKSRGG